MQKGVMTNVVNTRLVTHMLDRRIHRRDQVGLEIVGSI